MGRQPAIGETRATALIIRCTASERRRWQQVARASGLTVSDLVRHLLDEATSRGSRLRLSDLPVRTNGLRARSNEPPKQVVATPRTRRKAPAR